METDDKLIEYYIDGFNDELNGTFMQGISLSEMAEKSYSLGGLHAVLEIAEKSYSLDHNNDVKNINKTGIDNIKKVEILNMIR